MLSGTALMEEDVAVLRKPRRRRRWLLWTGIALLFLTAVAAVTAVILARRAGPILRDRILETLRASFHGRIELGNVEVFALHGFEVRGENLRIYPPETVAPRSDAPPLLALKQFSFHAPWAGALFKPTHVGLVQVDGLDIEIPPPAQRQPMMQQEPPAQEPQKGKKRDKIQVLVDDIVCENSRLVVANANPNKGPEIWDLHHIELHNVGGQSPWNYRANLTNAVPRGEIHAQGTFGPWEIDSPAETPVTGHYTFDHADLNTINGLGGILSSIGDYTGKLDRIEVNGTTETPDFSLDSANHPVPLHTQFHAIVDGVTGDTYLQPVQAKLRNSSFTASGAVVDVKGKGHIIDLTVDVTAGRLQDFLDLAVQTRPAVLTALISTKAHLHIHPGKERVVRKLAINGRFQLSGMHFSNPEVQDKVDMLSYRARGEPEKAKPGAEDVRSGMDGVFALDHGSISFSNLVYTMPGAEVHLTGDYSLDGQVFDFHGHVLTDVPLAKMVQSRWASLALRLASPFFHRKGGGADIPVKISGTRSAPKFGLDVLGHHSKDSGSI